MSAQLVADCPRCGSSRITFDVAGEVHTQTKYDWQRWYEVFCVCRHCRRATIFALSFQREAPAVTREMLRTKGLTAYGATLNGVMNVEGTITLKDNAGVVAPEYLPSDIAAVFAEGATCLATRCYNAAGTMFRLCVDLATRSKLPAGDAPGLNAKVRRDLGLRLPWLFDNGLLPEALRELSACIKEDGNDGAHAGTLKKEEAEDLLDFTTALLERLYTEPERLRLAKERRDARRNPDKPPA